MNTIIDNTNEQDGFIDGFRGGFKNGFFFFFRFIFKTIPLHVFNKLKADFQGKTLKEQLSDIVGFGLVILFYFVCFFDAILTERNFFESVGYTIGSLLPLYLGFCAIYLFLNGILYGFLVTPYRIYRGITSYEKGLSTNASYKALIATSFMIIVIASFDSMPKILDNYNFIEGIDEMKIAQGVTGLFMLFSLMTYILSLYGDGIKISNKEEKERKSTSLGSSNTPYIIFSLIKFIILPFVLFYSAFLMVLEPTKHVYLHVIKQIIITMIEANNPVSAFVYSIVMFFHKCVILMWSVIA